MVFREWLFENLLKGYWIWFQGFHYKWLVDLDVVRILSPIPINELIANEEHWYFLIYLWLNVWLHPREITSCDYVLGDIYLILLNIDWLNVWSFLESRRYLLVFTTFSVNLQCFIFAGFDIHLFIVKRLDILQVVKMGPALIQPLWLLIEKTAGWRFIHRHCS